MFLYKLTKKFEFMNGRKKGVSKSVKLTGKFFSTNVFIETISRLVINETFFD